MRIWDILLFEGAVKKCHPVITEEIQERIDSWILIISNLGYPGYSLIAEEDLIHSFKVWASA
jgi:DNA polymerase III alpha subunit